MRARGFTLIELLVVLGILAALSLVAVRSMSGLKDQGHFEQSQRVLVEVEDALLGSTSRWSEQAYVPGFLSDLGRLPNAGPADRQLLELWQLPAGVEQSHIRADSVDKDVVLAIGWRGPYVQLPVGSDQLTDGFGNPLRYQRGTPPWLVLAPGADASPGGQDYDADLSVVLLDPTLGIDRVATELAGTVTVLTAPPGLSQWSVLVFAYVPSPSADALLAVREDVENPPETGSGSPPFVFHYRFSGANLLTPGIRALRAYVYEAVVGQDPRANAHKKSTVATRVLIPGAQTIDLEVP